MKENGSQFIAQVVDFYYSTIDSEHPQGNMSAAAEHFSVTRAKVNKILITAGVIDSPLHQDIMELKARGYDTEDIASALGVSAATVKINMPYEKVLYSGEGKSAGAEYTESFRKREKVFLNNVVRKKTDFEKQQEAFFSDPANRQIYELWKDRGLIMKETGVEDDPVHLLPNFSDEEAKLFKRQPDVMVLHIELDADCSEVKDLAGIKYPSMFRKGRFTISRDLLVPDDIPLHNLHYALNQAFGFTNSHLHEYTLSDHDLMWLTEGKISRWKKYIGLVFKNPVRDEDTDFWDDDYEGGSPKKWMRSKYTGPVYDMVYEESYPYGQEQMKNVKIRAKTVRDLRMEFEFDPLALNEALPLYEILSENGQKDYADVKAHDRLMEECFAEAKKYSPRMTRSQPYLYSFARELHYNYDFGDDWNFTIRPMKDVEYLIGSGRLTAHRMKEAVKDVCVLARPVVLAADGLPLVEDVGGTYGYEDFLKGINGMESQMYEDREGSLSWAKWNGWPGKIGNLKTLL